MGLEADVGQTESKHRINQGSVTLAGVSFFFFFGLPTLINTYVEASIIWMAYVTVELHIKGQKQILLMGVISSLVCGTTGGISSGTE